MDEMDKRPLEFKTYVQQRVTALRLHKGISERKMSLDIGKSSSYIRGISCGKALPSMKELLSICDYCGITVEEFFAGFEVKDPQKYELQERIRTLDAESVQKLLELLDWAGK